MKKTVKGAFRGIDILVSPEWMNAYWNQWQPRERATLCFVIRGEEILLIRKKRGLGAGKINAPGGRLESGETAHDAAIRETQEELMVTPLRLERKGELHFQFADGYSLHCVVFFADGCHGVAVETEEAIPVWTPLDQIPYEDMWADDRHWLPGAIAGKTFRGYFQFDGDTMLEKQVLWD